MKEEEEEEEEDEVDMLLNINKLTKSKPDECRISKCKKSSLEIIIATARLVRLWSHILPGRVKS